MHPLSDLLPTLGLWLIPAAVGLVLWFTVWRRRPVQAFRFNPLKFGLMLLAFALALGVFRSGWAVSALGIGTFAVALLLDYLVHERRRHLPRTSDARTWQVMGLVAVLAMALAAWQAPLGDRLVRASTMGLHLGPLPVELLLWSLGLTLLGVVPGAALPIPARAGGKP